MAKIFLEDKNITVELPDDMTPDQMTNVIQRDIYGKADNNFLDEGVDFLKETGKGVFRGVESTMSGVGAVTRLFGENLKSRYKESRNDLDQTLGVKMADKIIDWGEDARNYWQKQQESGIEAADVDLFRGSFTENPSFKRAVVIIAEAIPSLATATAITYATKNPTAGAASLGILQAGEQSSEALDVGKDVKTANVVFGASAIGNTLFEIFPLTRYLRGGGSGYGLKKVAKDIFVGAAQEGTEEVAQQLWSNLIAKIGYDETRVFTEGVVESLIGGAGSGGIIGGVTSGHGQRVDISIKNALDSGVSYQQIEQMREVIANEIVAHKDVIDNALTENAKANNQEMLLLEDKSVASGVTEATQPTTPEGGGILNNLNPTGKIFTEYTPEQRAKLPLGENITTLDKTMGKSADEIITVYRGGGEIAEGDFITTNKQLAKDYAGTGKVYEKKVKLSDILDDKTEPLGEEYIYRPKLPTPAKEGGGIKVLTTGNIKHLDPDLYSSREDFVRDVEKLNPIPMDMGWNRKAMAQIDEAFEIWGDRNPNKRTVEIPVDKVDLVEKPLPYEMDSYRDIINPIDVNYSNGRYRLVDGRHRLAQAKFNKQKTIIAQVVGETPLERATLSKLPTPEGGGITEDAFKEKLSQLRESYRSKGIDLSAYGSMEKGVELSKLEVPKKQRGQGKARQAMEDLVKFADDHGVRLTLSPTNEFGASKSRLTDFYKEFGFVENKGKNKNYQISRLMYREPNPSTPAPAKDGGGIVAYHGTKENFDQFKKSNDIGFHFGTREQASDPFIVGTQGKGRIIEAKIDIKNPLRIQDLGKWQPDKWVEELTRKSKIGEFDATPEELSGLEDAIYNVPLKNGLVDNEAKFKIIREFLKSKGYDGIVYANAVEGRTSKASPKNDSYIVFDKSQISKLPTPAEGKGTESEKKVSKKDQMASRLEEVEKAKIALEAGGQVERYLLDNKIRKYGNNILKEELQALPSKYVTKNQDANTIDQALDEMRNRGIGDFASEYDLTEYLKSWEVEKERLMNVIDENKPKKVTRYEDTILKQQDSIIEKEKSKAEKAMRDMTEEHSKIAEKLVKKAYIEGKKEGAEVRKQKYFGIQISKDERKKLYLLGKEKGLIYTDYKGVEHNKLGSVLQFYRGASFDQYAEYISNLTGDLQNPPQLVKMFGDIDKDTALMKLLNEHSQNWGDINKLEVNTLDMRRIAEKVTGVDAWDGNILSDNTFRVIQEADHFILTRRVKELDSLKQNRQGVEANSKESAKIMQKFEAGEALTEKEQKVVDYLRSKYDELLQEMNEVRARLGKKPIPRRKDYMTHIIEQSLLDEFFGSDETRMANISDSQMEAIRKGDYTKGDMPFNRFAQKRLGKQTKYDAIGNYTKYLDVALREIYISQAINHSRKFINYALKRQPNAFIAMDRMLNNLKGKPSIADQSPIGVLASHKYVQWVRTKIAGNALIGNINFWATNLSNFSISYGELGNYMSVGVTKFLVDKSWRDFAFKNSVMLQGRSIDPDLDPTKFESIKKAVSAVTNLIEYNNVGSTFVGAYIKATEQLKYDSKKAIRYADDIAARTQAGYKKYELNLWMQSNSGKVLSQFQSWSFNMMNHIIYDMKLGNMPSDMVAFVKQGSDIKGVRWGAFMRLLATSIIVNMMYKAMGLREPYKVDSAIPVIPGFNHRYYNIAPAKILDDIYNGVASKDKDVRRKAQIRVSTMLALPFGGAQVGRFLEGKVFPDATKGKKKKTTGFAK